MSSLPTVCWRPAFNAQIQEPTWRRRGYYIIQGLQRHGVDIHATWDLEEKCDVFVLQRAANINEVKQLQDRGVIVIFDINDNHLFATFNNPQDALVGRQVDYVVAATRWLAQRYKELNPNSVVIHEAVEDEFFTYKRKPMPETPTVISWHGTLDNLQYIETFIDAFGEVARNHDVLFKFVMSPTDSQGKSNVERIKQYPMPSELVPWTLETFVSEIAQAHIGIAPIPDTEFCRSKGYHKAIGYMALGVPCVASDIVPYREVIKHNTSGLLAATHRDWTRCLNRLIEDQELRTRVIKNGQKMAQYFRFEYVVDKWLHFLKMIWKEHRSK